MDVSPPERAARALLLGESERVYGRYGLGGVPSAGVASALSVGSDAKTLANLHKGNASAPNEDGVLVIAEESRVLLAVADAHFGAFASHAMLRHLAETVDRVPSSPAELLRVLRQPAEWDGEVDQDSETTLLVVVHRRDMGAGFGLSFGDSSCAVLGAGHRGVPLARPNNSYVTPVEPRSLSPDRASFFEFDVRPGGLVVAFTDGVDACHYEHPETSLRPRHLMDLFGEVGPQPESYAERLVQWALAGCDGNPGGQDNIAIAVART